MGYATQKPVALLERIVKPESTEWTARGQGKGVRELQAR